MIIEAPALVVVDMQRYYLESDSTFARFHTHVEPGCLDYIHERCQETVIPNVVRLIEAFEKRKDPVLYLRLCGEAPDRSDIHRTFAKVHHEAEKQGFPGLYPLKQESESDVTPAFASASSDNTFCKTTYSVFTSNPDFEAHLQATGRRALIFTGLATSQCVETTARDASDRGYAVIQVEDAQADYSETTHRASLYSSQGVCGGHIYLTNDVIAAL